MRRHYRPIRLRGFSRTGEIRLVFEPLIRLGFQRPKRHKTNPRRAPISSGILIKTERNCFDMTDIMVTRNEQNVKNKNAFSFLAQNKRFEYYIAGEILTDSNELAADILVINGFTALDEDNFATIRDMAGFYGVNKDYVYNLTWRLSLNAPHCPEDVIRTPNGLRFSARVILALSALMFAGRKIPANSKASQVYQNLTNTRYFKRAEENKRRGEEIENTASSEATRVFGDEIEVTQEGKIVISAEALARVVRLAIAEPDKARSVGGITRVKSDAPQGNETPAHKGIRHNQCSVTATKDGVCKEFESIRSCAAYIGRANSTVCRAAKMGRKANGYSIEYI